MNIRYLLFQVFTFLSTFQLSAQASETVYKKCNKNGLFAFTFDQGPTMHTQTILNLLAENGTKVTFHVLPTWITSPGSQKVGIDAVKRAYKEGHIIGLCLNPQLSVNASVETLKKELGTASQEVKNVIGSYPKFLSAQATQLTSSLLQVAQSMEFIVTSPNIDMTSAARNENGTLLLKTILRPANDSESFISQHYDRSYADVATFPTIYKTVQQNGWNMVDLAECIGLEGAAYKSSNVGSDSSDITSVLPNHKVSGANIDFPHLALQWLITVGFVALHLIY